MIFLLYRNHLNHYTKAVAWLESSAFTVLENDLFMHCWMLSSGCSNTTKHGRRSSV